MTEFTKRFIKISIFLLVSYVVFYILWLASLSLILNKYSGTQGFLIGSPYIIILIAAPYDLVVGWHPSFDGWVSDHVLSLILYNLFNIILLIVYSFILSGVIEFFNYIYKKIPILPKSKGGTLLAIGIILVLSVIVMAPVDNILNLSQTQIVILQIFAVTQMGTGIGLSLIGLLKILLLKIKKMHNNRLKLT